MDHGPRTSDFESAVKHVFVYKTVQRSRDARTESRWNKSLVAEARRRDGKEVEPDFTTMSAVERLK
jgi:hypothetical protein